jgi:lipopolysaccharide heptosyltransferase II
MNSASHHAARSSDGSRATQIIDHRPILIVPYMWIGDFVRCHTVAKLLKARFPARPVDVVASRLCAPLADYMPEVRQAVVADLSPKRLVRSEYRALAERLKAGGYGTALIMSRKWKAALAPFLAGIPERAGFFGEWRFGLLNDIRFGERKLERMVDRCAALALPRSAHLPVDLPKPELKVPAAEIDAWRAQRGLGSDGRPVAALAPGAVGPSKRWPSDRYGELARQLAQQGLHVWVLGGPDEKSLAAEIVGRGGPGVHDLTGNDLRNAILALAAADVAVSNDSGLLHVAAALGTPSVGIFGPTSPWHWAPLNPLAAVIQAATDLPCRPCHQPVCYLAHHRCMRDIAAEQVLAAARNALVT